MEPFIPLPRNSMSYSDNHNPHARFTSHEGKLTRDEDEDGHDEGNETKRYSEYTDDYLQQGQRYGRRSHQQQRHPSYWQEQSRKAKNYKSVLNRFDDEDEKEELDMNERGALDDVQDASMSIHSSGSGAVDEAVEDRDDIEEEEEFGERNLNENDEDDGEDGNNSERFESSKDKSGDYENIEPGATQDTIVSTRLLDERSKQIKKFDVQIKTDHLTQTSISDEIDVELVTIHNDNDLSSDSRKIVPTIDMISDVEEENQENQKVIHKNPTKMRDENHIQADTSNSLRNKSSIASSSSETSSIKLQSINESDRKQIHQQDEQFKERNKFNQDSMPSNKQPKRKYNNPDDGQPSSFPNQHQKERRQSKGNGTSGEQEKQQNTTQDNSEHIRNKKLLVKAMSDLNEWLEKNNKIIDKILDEIEGKNKILSNPFQSWNSLSEEEKTIHENKIIEYKKSLLDDITRLDNHFERLKVERNERQKQVEMQTNLFNSLSKQSNQDHPVPYFDNDHHYRSNGYKKMRYSSFPMQINNSRRYRKGETNYNQDDKIEYVDQEYQQSYYDEAGNQNERGSSKRQRGSTQTSSSSSRSLSAKEENDNNLFGIGDSYGEGLKSEKEYSTSSYPIESSSFEQQELSSNQNYSLYNDNRVEEDLSLSRNKGRSTLSDSSYGNQNASNWQFGSNYTNNNESNMSNNRGLIDNIHDNFYRKAMGVGQPQHQHLTPLSYGFPNRVGPQSNLYATENSHGLLQGRLVRNQPPLPKR